MARTTRPARNVSTVAKVTAASAVKSASTADALIAAGHVARFDVSTLTTPQARLAYLGLAALTDTAADAIDAVRAASRATSLAIIGGFVLESPGKGVDTYSGVKVPRATSELRAAIASAVGSPRSASRYLAAARYYLAAAKVRDEEGNLVAPDPTVTPDERATRLAASAWRYAVKGNKAATPPAPKDDADSGADTGSDDGNQESALSLRDDLAALVAHAARVSARMAEGVESRDRKVARGFASALSEHAAAIAVTVG